MRAAPSAASTPRQLRPLPRCPARRARRDHAAHRAHDEARRARRRGPRPSARGRGIRRFGVFITALGSVGCSRRGFYPRTTHRARGRPRARPRAIGLSPRSVDRQIVGKSPTGRTSGSTSRQGASSSPIVPTTLRARDDSARRARRPHREPKRKDALLRLSRGPAPRDGSHPLRDATEAQDSDECRGHCPCAACARRCVRADSGHDPGGRRDRAAARAEAGSADE